MAGPESALIGHYMELFARLDGSEWIVGESLCWTVVRPHTVDAVVRLIGGDPAAMTTACPADLGWQDDQVFVEQRGDAVVLVGPSDAGQEEEKLRRLSSGGTVHQVLWMINNYNRLIHVADDVVITELDTLDPGRRWGADPDALDGHLGALHDLDALEDARGADADWPTAMATMESITGVRLDADWFLRPRPLATITR
ncbi:DUF6461 domain-containing protein [Actinoplanes sp. NPDC049802]|uniref:DUF6461 domain-containing protein n=1 Tax=Actinoplanes sp. NPDC049802 TaxID=3154742 RepID=UPI003405DA48